MDAAALVFGLTGFVIALTSLDDINKLKKRIAVLENKNNKKEN